jgi:ATP-dependent helicase HrpB
VEAEERPRGTPLVRAASAIDAESLLETFPERVREESALEWDDDRERVETARRVLYDDLVLEERRRDAQGSAGASDLLRERALAAGPAAFADPEAVSRLLARVALVARTFPERGIAPLGEEDVRAALLGLCEGRSSFADVREAGLLGALAARRPGAVRAFVDAMAPERVAVHPDWAPRLHYAPARPPWIEALVQDFFGRTAGPAVCDGRVPVVLYLLAPNRRPVQVTTDLAGFWVRHYPVLRRELSRRYPRHAWPEDPQTARPPARGRSR